MSAVRIHQVGNWAEHQVSTMEVPSTHVVQPEVQDQIDEAWTTAAARPGVHLFDGPMVRWEGWDATPERLSLRLSRTSYKAFLGTNMSNPQLDRALLANPVGLSAALVTADGSLVLGRRNAAVAYYPNRIHPFAGALEPRDASNIFGGLRRELREELSLLPAEMVDVRCIGIVEDASLRQGELIFRVQTTLTYEALRARVDEREHRASVAARPDEVESLLENPDQLTPVCVATVLLWARDHLGDSWFRDRSARFATRAL